MDAADKNTTGLYSDSQQAPYDMVRSERSQLLSKMVFGPSYTTNSAKETVILDFAENFRAQYTHLFPTRAPLLLSPLNECLKPKFISTFIRPTLLPYSELYDYEACAQFVANYLTFDHLEDPEAFPHRIMSPTTVMSWQVGNSVEISIVLASLLIGAGYNAYVVLGYAARDVVDNDQTGVQWPGSLPEEPFSDDEEDKVDTTLDTRFAQFLKRRPKLISTFDTEGAGGDANATPVNEPNVSGGGNLDTPPPEGEGEEPPRRLCHAWVAILPKKRKIDAPMFIEPSTGAVSGIGDTNYHGVEAMFNNVNYFVNMAPEAPPSRVSFDVYDLTQWEHVFLADPQLVDEDGVGAGSASSPTGGAGGDGDRAKAEEMASDVGESGDVLIDLPSSWVDPITLNRSQYENRYPGRSKTVRYAGGIVVTNFAEYADPELKVLQVRIPDELSAGDQVHTFFKHRTDLLRREAVLPSYDRSQDPREIHEWYLPGRKKETHVEALREVIERHGESRALRFYWRAREDGLAERTEFFFEDKSTTQPRMIVERYRGRGEDRLYYRSATYEQAKSPNSHVGTTLTNGAHAASREGKSEEEPPIELTEKFRRNPAIAASTDVMARTFVRPNTPQGEIWVNYHYRADSITQASRMYLRSADKDRDGLGAGAGGVGGGGGGDMPETEVVVMPFDDKPREHTLREELRALIAAEKECLQEIRSRVDECRELFANRNASGNEPVLSVYDTLRNRPQETEVERQRQKKEEQRRQESRKDYLAPYIAMLSIEKSLGGDYANVRLTGDDAKFVRDSALKDLKERLIQRGHIMQARMDREKEELNKRQVAYQKNLDTTENPKDNDEFARFLSQATWRMKILDDRLTRHIEQASEKYAELAQKLAADKRLGAIYDGK